MIVLLGAVSIFEIIVFFLSKNQTLSFFGTFERHQGLMYSIIILTFLFLLITLNKKSLHKIFVYTTHLLALCSLYGISQHLGYDPFFNESISIFSSRISSLLGNPNILSQALLISIGMTYYLLQYHNNNSKFQTLMTSSIMIQIFTLFLTGSRVVIILFLLATIIGTLYFYRKNDKVRIFIVCIVIATCLFTLSTERFSGILNDSSVLTRVALFKSTLSNIHLIPIFGFGQDSQSIFTNLIYPMNLISNSLDQPKIDRIHNVFLDILVTRGIAGLVFYLLLIGYVLQYLLKYILNSKEKEKTLYLLSLTGIFFLSIQTSFITHIHFILLSIILASIISLVSPVKEDSTYTFKSYHVILICFLIPLYISHLLFSFQTLSLNSNMYKNINKVSMNHVLNSPFPNFFFFSLLLDNSNDSKTIQKNLQSMIKKFPENEELHLSLASNYLRNKNDTQFASIIKNVRSIKPLSVERLYFESYQLIQNKNFCKAKELINSSFRQRIIHCIQDNQKCKRSDKGKTHTLLKYQSLYRLLQKSCK